MSKDTYIRIRLTAEEKEQIKAEAKRRKTNMSDFVLTATRKTIAKGECTKSDMDRINKALLISLGMEETWQDERNTTTHQYRNARR